MRFEKWAPFSLVLLSIPAFAQIEPSTLVVLGKATQSARADTAYVVLYVKETRPLMTDALAAAKAEAAALEKAVRGASGTKLASVRTEIVSMGAKADETWRSDKQTNETPEVTFRLVFTLPADPALAAQVVDVGIRNGAFMRLPSRVHYGGEREGAVFFGVEKEAGKYEALARAEAIKAGRAAAADTAAASNVQLGGLLEIERAPGLCGPQDWRVDGRDLTMLGKYLSNDPDKVEVTACQRMKFEIVGK